MWGVWNMIIDNTLYVQSLSEVLALFIMWGVWIMIIENTLYVQSLSEVLALFIMWGVRIMIIENTLYVQSLSWVLAAFLGLILRILWEPFRVRRFNGRLKPFCENKVTTSAKCYILFSILNKIIAMKLFKK